MQNNLTTRIITVVLTFAALITVTACSGSATEIIADGKVDNLRWAISEDGELSFTGTGAIPGVEYILSMETGQSEMIRPGWYDYREQVTGVVIGDGIDSVSMNAFMNFPSLRTIDISSTVRSIDGYAVTGCPSLEEVIIRNATVKMERFCIGYVGGTAENYLGDVTFRGASGSETESYANNCGAQFSRL